MRLLLLRRRRFRQRRFQRLASAILACTSAGMALPVVFAVFRLVPPRTVAICFPVAFIVRARTIMDTVLPGSVLQRVVHLGAHEVPALAGQVAILYRERADLPGVRG